MNNNDILTRLRYALDIKDAEMVDIFKLGGIVTTKEDVQAMLAKVKADSDHDDVPSHDYRQMIDIAMLECFLNGLIAYKRGPQPETLETAKNQFLMSSDLRNVNNIVLKKVKIALSLTSEDMLDILDEAGITLSKSELSAVLRKEGHRNYKECGDRYARNFLKGLALRYRED